MRKMRQASVIDKSLTQAGRQVVHCLNIMHHLAIEVAPHSCRMHGMPSSRCDKRREAFSFEVIEIHQRLLLIDCLSHLRFDGVGPNGQGQGEQLQKVFEENQRLAQVRLQELAAEGLRIEGGGTWPGFTAGLRFALEGHPHANGDYLLPTVLNAVSPDVPAAHREYMFPFVTVVQCPEAKLIEAMGPTLVCTAITNNAALRRRLLDAVHVDRLNFGPVPTIQLNWLQPHEGNLIEFSGSADTDFFAFSRRMSGTGITGAIEGLRPIGSTCFSLFGSFRASGIWGTNSARVLAVGIDDDVGRALDGCDRVYIAFDCDVLRPGELSVFMPEPGGPIVSEAEQIVRDVAVRWRHLSVGPGCPGY